MGNPLPQMAAWIRPKRVLTKTRSTWRSALPIVTRWLLFKTTSHSYRDCLQRGEYNAQDLELDCTCRRPHRGLGGAGRYHDRIRDLAQRERLLDRHPVRTRHRGGL